MILILCHRFEATFIPNINPDCFFVWMTDEDGKPISPSDPSRIQTELSKIHKRDALHLESAQNKTLSLEFKDERLRVKGVFIPMHHIFQLLQGNDFRLHPHMRMHYGETLHYWQHIAAGLAMLIKAGQFYPTLFSVEKDGHHHFFAHWMLARGALHKTATERQWMAHIPPRALCAADLAAIPVRQWFNVLLDSWVDRIVRHAVAPAYASAVANWPDTDILHDVPAAWFYFLVQEESAFFARTADEAELSRYRTAVKQIRAWHKPLSPPGEPDPVETLVQFKHTFMESYILPLTLMLCVAPVNSDDAFHAQSEWRLSLKIAGEQAGSAVVCTTSELLSNHPSSTPWLWEKFERLIQLDGTFRTLYDERFPQIYTAETLFNVYRRHHDALEREGIYFQFPKWLRWQQWTDRDVEISLTLSSAGQSEFTLTSIVEFNWKVSIGDVSFSLAEFKKMVAQKKRFLKHRGEWVELPLHTMQKALQALHETHPGTADHPRRKGNGAEALRHVIAANHRRGKQIHIHMDKSLAAFFSQLKKKPDDDFPVPAAFQGTLRPYQQQGYAWLARLAEIGVGGCLADDMGLGKTIQTIAYVLYRPRRSSDNPVLIVCPTSVLGNWKRELHTFAPSLRVYVHHGPRRWNARQFARDRHRYDVMITSYPLVTRDKAWLSEEKWPALIIDEAQAIKNPATQQSQTIRRLRAEHRIALTGTPMENRLEELWTIMDFLNPGYLGARETFRKQFIIPIEKKQDKKKLQLLRRLVQPFLLRREKTDRSVIADLPDKIERKERCPLSKEQAVLYQSVVDQLKEKMHASYGIQRKGLILAALTKLKQVCNHPALLTGGRAAVRQSGKVQRFFELLRPLLAQNQRCLVFTQYVRMGHLLQTLLTEQFPDCPVYFLHGGLPSVTREQVIKRFRGHHGEKAVFILSLKAGGLGLNLTEANHVIHYDRWWNPAVEDQATDRTYRIGQTKNVHVYKLISEGTLEENIDRLIDKKRTLTEEIIGQGDRWITELDDEALFELIRLREKVVS